MIRRTKKLITPPPSYAYTLFFIISIASFSLSWSISTNFQVLIRCFKEVIKWQEGRKAAMRPQGLVFILSMIHVLFEYKKRLSDVLFSRL